MSIKIELALAAACAAFVSGPSLAEDAVDLRLVGHDDLQARSAYQPIVHAYGERRILFVGHHAGEALNPQTGKVEKNGLSIVDVTNPAAPKYLVHVPPTGAEASGTQHVQVCDGSALPHVDGRGADRSKVYAIQKLAVLACFNAGVRVVDIRNPFAPVEVAHFIPEITARTSESCVDIDGKRECQRAIQTNNVNLDDRGYIYALDRASTGLHILELTGTAREIAGL